MLEACSAGGVQVSRTQMNGNGFVEGIVKNQEAQLSESSDADLG